MSGAACRDSQASGRPGVKRCVRDRTGLVERNVQGLWLTSPTLIHCSQATIKIADAYTPIAKFKRQMSKNDLPKEVDWRGTGADPGVKDQVTIWGKGSGGGKCEVP